MSSGERAVRRLAAIMSADAAGYTRLVRADEAGTRKTLRTLFDDVFAPAIAGHGGRIVKTMGDGLLAEFKSVVDAVECAVVLQARLAAENADRPAERRIDFRIGVNLGDVIVEGDDIHGDGVNVAARLEQLAAPGGVAISGGAFDEVRARLPYRFADMGPQQVRNIVEPIQAYRLVRDDRAGADAFPTVATDAPGGGLPSARVMAMALMAFALVLAGGFGLWRTWQPDFARASVENMAFPLPDKPSIAVLPLDDVSGDAEQAYFADGLTEDVITRLAGFENLFVIARSSTEKYRGRAADIRHVAEDLGVQYVLEGSVRRAGDDLRVTVRLVDALKGANIWAESYDRKMVEVFAVQDEITYEVVSRLASNVMAAEFSRQSGEGTRDIEAYDLFLRGWHVMQVLTPKTNAQGIDLMQRAIARDPNYARAIGLLALGHAQSARFRWTEDPSIAAKTGLELARRAVEMAPDDDFTLRMLGSVLRLIGDHDEAIEVNQKALARSPSNPQILLGLALTYAYAGRPQEALESIVTAVRLDPYSPSPARFQFRGVALYVNGDYEAAVEDFARFQKANPDLVISYQFLAAAYGQLGRAQEAAATRQEVLKRIPNFTIDGFLKSAHLRGIARERVVEGMRKAGFPEGGPS